MPVSLGYALALNKKHISNQELVWGGSAVVVALALGPHNKKVAGLIPSFSPEPFCEESGRQFSLCLQGFSPGSLASSHTTKKEKNAFINPLQR